MNEPGIFNRANKFGFKTQTQFLDILGDNSRVVVIIFLDIVPRLLLVLAQVMYVGEFLLADCTNYSWEEKIPKKTNI